MRLKKALKAHPAYLLKFGILKAFIILPYAIFLPLNKVQRDKFAGFI